MLMKHSLLCSFVSAGILASTLAQAQPTFFATQLKNSSTSDLYRFTLTGAIEVFSTNVYVTGLTTVPQGVTVGNMNGGAKGGDVIGSRGGIFWRLDDAFGQNPHFVQIGVGAPDNYPNGSPFFVGNRLFAVGAALPAGAYYTEINPTNFNHISSEAMGVFGSANAGVPMPNGKIWFTEHNLDRLYEYTPGTGTSVLLGSLPNHDYTGMERFGGVNYTMMGLNPGGTGRFVLGQITDSGVYSQLRDVDLHVFNGQIGFTVATPVPEPATMGALALGIAVISRRRRSRD